MITSSVIPRTVGDVFLKWLPGCLVWNQTGTTSSSSDLEKSIVKKK